MVGEQTQLIGQHTVLASMRRWDDDGAFNARSQLKAVGWRRAPPAASLASTAAAAGTGLRWQLLLLPPSLPKENAPGKTHLVCTSAVRKGRRRGGGERLARPRLLR